MCIYRNCSWYSQKLYTIPEKLEYNNIYIQAFLINIASQLCSADNNTLLDWQHLSPRLLHLPTGKTPLWFSYLESTILSHTHLRTILPEFLPKGFNPFAYHTNLIPKSSKPWVLTYQNAKIIIGQTRKIFKKANSISITYWQHDIDTAQFNHYPLPQIICTSCQGCHLNSNHIANLCTLEVSAILSTQFFGRKHKNKQLKLNANYIDLIYSTAIKHPTDIPPPPTIYITNSLTLSLFYDNEACQKLCQIASTNRSQQ